MLCAHPGLSLTHSCRLLLNSPPHPDCRPAKCMLKVSNNEITRVRADVESLMFQSSVSPKLAVK